MVMVFSSKFAKKLKKKRLKLSNEFKNTSYSYLY